MTLEIGKKAPDFKLPSTEGDISLSDYKGKKLVLYFYPKADTSGCTKQALAFTQHLQAFKDKNVDIVGVSPDPISKIEKFKTKHDLKITLAGDEEKSVLQAYGVWVEKSMYGRKYMGVERTTVLIDEEGNICELWSKVKVPNHVETVLKAI